MAVLTDKEKVEIMRGCETDGSFEVDYTKAQVIAAMQALEDWFEKAAVRASLVADIDAATSPFTFSGPQKLAIIKHWLRQRFER